MEVSVQLQAARGFPPEGWMVTELDSVLSNGEYFLASVGERNGNAGGPSRSP
jgi:hypothetical protein